MHLLRWELVDDNDNDDGLRIQLDTNSYSSNWAILSHRWDNPNDEVSYDDMLTGQQKTKKGYSKILRCCQQARRDGHDRVWIDTCCINKSSSAELSEAITSMYTYYEQSKVCYVFLNDVLLDTDSDSRDSLEAKTLRESMWFTRGWTLQELIAPRSVKFFDSQWAFIGWKTDKQLRAILESITEIPQTVLLIPATAKMESVSRRMSWASRRNTTRMEDMAYSLMGLFGVYMTPRYGEGNNAFIRLQQAIMRTTNDHTIFAWTCPPTPPLDHGFEHVSTMLALSPQQFEHSGHFKPFSRTVHSKSSPTGELGYRLEHTVTNVGLAISLPMERIVEFDGLWIAFIACTEGEDDQPSAILLRSTNTTPAGHFWRTTCHEGPIERISRRWAPTTGRIDLEIQNVYVLPRFTSISGDHIEPSWRRVDKETKKRETSRKTSPSGRKISFAINNEMLKNLSHVADPSFDELASLRQSYRLIAKNQAAQLIDKTRNVSKPPSLEWTLPYPRNKYFSGRGINLRALHDALFPSYIKLKKRNEPITSCIIQGPRGVGKTELAIEFSYDSIGTHQFNTVLWIPAQSRESIIEALERIVCEIKLRGQENASDSAYDIIFQWLATFSGNGPSNSIKWLLVFDHASSVDSLREFWPSQGIGCVVVTSWVPDAWSLLSPESILLKPLGSSVSESGSSVGVTMNHVNADAAGD